MQVSAHASLNRAGYANGVNIIIGFKVLPSVDFTRGCEINPVCRHRRAFLVT